MHKLLKLIALLGIVAISSTLVVSTAMAEWYTPYVENLASVDVDFGDVGANTTRCEWAEGVVQWNGLIADSPAEPTFLDVPATHPCYEFIETAYAHGVLGGYTDAGGDPTGYFGPGDLVTREQAGKMIVEGEGLPLVEDSGIFPDEASLSGWFTDAYYHSTVYAWNKMVGDSDTGMFRGGDNINHAEAAKVITITAELNEDYLETPEDIIEAVGDLDVVISDDTPVGATLPSGATSVPMATWVFTAGEEDAVIGSVKIHRFGVSALPTGHSVYLYKGNERLTSGKNINSTTNLATFNNLNYELSAGESVELTLRMDIGTVAASGEIGFEVEEVDAGSGEVLLGDVKGDMFGLSTTSAGTVTIEKNGTVVDAKVGEKGFTLAKFKISAATENASIEEFGLYVGAGSVNTADLENFKLYVSGQTDPLAEVTSVNSRDIAQFLLADPYLLDKGDTRSFRVTAELNTGRTGDTIEAYIDETTDVVAIGATYGYGMIVAGTTYDGTTCTVATPTECNAMTLEGGDITIAGTTIVNRNIAVNQEDVSILNFTITAATDVTFDNFAIHLQATGASTAGMLYATGTPNFTDIKIVEVGGSHVWGPIDGDALVDSIGGTTVVTTGTDTQALYYIFTDDLIMEAGETREFELTLDVANVAALGDETITATIDIDATYPTMKDVNNKTLTNSTSLVPTSDYVGDAFTVKSNSLTVVRSAAVGSSTQVVGTDDVSLLALSVGAGDANAVTITQVKVTGHIGNNGGAFVEAVDTVYFNEVVLGMDLYEGSIAPENKINTSPKSADSGGEATFDNLTWTIPAGQTVTLYVVGELAANSAYDTDRLKIDIKDVGTDIIAEDEDGNSITSTSSDGPNGLTTDSATLYTQITISAGGTLAVDIPSNTPASEIVVAGTSGNEFSKIKFTSTQESFVINKMALRNSYSDTTVSTTVGDYDDNIDTLTVKYYTDEEQTVEGSTICAAAAESSYYVCTGMDMIVPDPDLSGVPDYATLTVEADLNDVADDLADEGDKPYFAPSLAYDFEATGSSSGKKIEENGTNSLTVTDSVIASYTAGDNAAAAADLTLVTDLVLALGNNDVYVEGTLICIDADDDDCDATDEIAYVIARCTDENVPHDDCTADNDVVLKRGVTRNSTTAIDVVADTNVDIDYYLPTSVLPVNYMQVQATDISVTASSSTRTGSTGSTEAILTFTATANAAKDPLLRQGVAFTTLVTGTGASPVANDEAVDTIDGTSSEVTGDGGTTDNESFYFVVGDSTGYSRASWWMNVDDDEADQGIDTVDFTKMTAFTSPNAIATGNNETVLTNPVTTPLVDSWYLFDIAIPSGTEAADVNFGWEIDTVATFTNDTGGFEVSDELFIDQFKLYNEKLNVDLKLNENWAAVTPTVAYLKQNGTTVATAYVDLDGVVSSRTGQITFIPVGTYADIEINGTDTFVVEMDTATAITDDATATEKLTATIDLGNVDTVGDVFWYDGSSILNFLGVNTTDKIDTVTSY